MKRNYLTITLVAGLGLSCWLMPASAADSAKASDLKLDAITVTDTSLVVTPSVTYAGVTGNKSAFREATGIKDGWSGGLEEFALSSKINKDTTLNLDGRGLFSAADYKLGLELVKPEFYFVRAGYSTWRKYYNDMGGYFATNNFGPVFIPQDRDLHVDVRKLFFEAGILMPNLPKVTIGYERQEKEGTKSMLEWGSVIFTNVSPKLNSTSGLKIYPSFKDINEHTDIVKLEVEQDVKKIHIANNFRYERFQATDMQYDMAKYYLPKNVNITNSTTTYATSYKNDLYNNIFHVDSRVNDQLYWSAGYMFNRFDGSDGFAASTVPTNAPGLRTSQFEGYTTSVNLDSDSHVLNGNLMYQPCKTIILNAGIQGELTDQSALQYGKNATIANPIGSNTIYNTETDKRSLNETFGMRYIGIPFTTVYAEGNLAQEQTSYRWNDLKFDMNGAANMVEQVNAQREAVKVGFNTSPISRTTFSTYYRHSISDEYYDYRTTEENLFNTQKKTSDEFVTKLTLRPTSRVMVALQYRLAVSDIYLDSVANSADPKGGYSGNYQSSTYTISTTVTPINRLYVTGLLSYQDTKTACQYNGALYIAPYRGNVYTALTSIGYAIDDKTDITAGYDFSYQNNFNSSVAAGSGYNYLTDDRCHSIKAGLKRKINKNMTTNIQYEYDENVESSTGGINNYRANVVTAACVIRF